MIPGLPQILTCPFCRKKKEVMTLASGNTCGARFWSDNKMIAPMLPEVSYVQKCPHCKKYYIMGRQKRKLATHGDFNLEQGLLSFPEMKEAFAQLSSDGFRKGEEAQVRMMLHQAYNDYYYRSEHKSEVNEEDRQLFHRNALWLIDNFISDNLLKAEFYREIGEFETAYEVLSSVDVEDDYLKNVQSAIQQRLDLKDCEVFEIRQRQRMFDRDE